eukprot:scaffold3825_cov179-Ochromonas_danica.AAC.4
MVLGADDNVEIINRTKKFNSNKQDKRGSSTGKAKVVLVPHQHTLFCERKQRVCTAVGKCQEMEVVEVQGVPNKLASSCWIRIPSPNNASTIDESSYQVISGSENSTQYTLQREDVGCFIGFRYKTADGEKAILVENPIGPVLPGPPRLLDFRIEGDNHEGGTIRAEGNYIGGHEGPSEYWWMRISPSGQRTQVTEPAPIPSGKQASGKSATNDPRLYRLTKG